MVQAWLKAHQTIEHENKWEENLTGPGQGAALEDGTMPHSDRGAWENVGPLQDAKGSAPNATNPNEPDRQHGSLPENQPGGVGGEQCDRCVARHFAGLCQLDVFERPGWAAGLAPRSLKDY